MNSNACRGFPWQACTFSGFFGERRPLLPIDRLRPRHQQKHGLGHRTKKRKNGNPECCSPTRTQPKPMKNILLMLIALLAFTKPTQADETDTKLPDPDQIRAYYQQNAPSWPDIPRLVLIVCPIPKPEGALHPAPIAAAGCLWTITQSGD